MHHSLSRTIIIASWVRGLINKNCPECKACKESGVMRKPRGKGDYHVFITHIKTSTLATVFELIINPIYIVTFIGCVLMTRIDMLYVLDNARELAAHGISSGY